MTPTSSKSNLFRIALRHFDDPHIASQITGFLMEVGIVKQPATDPLLSRVTVDRQPRPIPEITTLDDLLTYITDQQRRYQTVVLLPKQSQEIVSLISRVRDSIRASQG